MARKAATGERFTLFPRIRVSMKLPKAAMRRARSRQRAAAPREGVKFRKKANMPQAAAKS
jgi:hypothetical protein